MKIFILSALIGIFISSIGISKTVAQDAASILDKMDNIMFSPKDKQGKIKIVLTNKSGKEKIREAIMKQKGTDKKLFRYTLPESQAGIATLSLPDDIMWLYMPAFGKPKKISLLAKSQAFTGTDFSYEDMVTKPYSERYVPELKSTGQNAFVMELTPISQKSNYSKIVVSVDKSSFYPLKMEYFNKGDKKIKEAVYSYRKSGIYWYAEEVTMTDLKKNHSTRILMTDVKFDQGLTDDEFAVENLVPIEPGN